MLFMVETKQANTPAFCHAYFDFAQDRPAISGRGSKNYWKRRVIRLPYIYTGKAGLTLLGITGFSGIIALFVENMVG